MDVVGLVFLLKSCAWGVDEVLVMDVLLNEVGCEASPAQHRFDSVGLKYCLFDAVNEFSPI